ncbi:hypothetical protein BDR22DRAFT_697815 [Usnea florida]
MLEDLEDSRNGFIKFARSQNAPEWLKEQPWLSQEEEIIEAVSEARAVEAEARDHMQLQIGNLSIEESRKSIQLSNQQMSEAKLKICEQRFITPSSIILRGGSHNPSFHLCTDQPCHFCIWHESSRAQSERPKSLVFCCDCDSGFAYHRLSVGYS